MIVSFDFGSRLTEETFYAVVFVEVVRSVLHAVGICFSEEKIGDERAGICVIRLRGYEKNAAFRIDLTNAFYCTYRCCGVAYDEIFSLLHDSSLLENYCIIRTAFYACGLSERIVCAKLAFLYGSCV